MYFYVLGCDSDTFCMQMGGKSIRYFLESIEEEDEVNNPTSESEDDSSYTIFLWNSYFNIHF